MGVGGVGGGARTGWVEVLEDKGSAVRHHDTARTEAERGGAIRDRREHIRNCAGLNSMVTVQVAYCYI